MIMKFSERARVILDDYSQHRYQIPLSMLRMNCVYMLIASEREVSTASTERKL
jgi:hypothetical protein